MALRADRRVRVSGPLAGFREGFAAELAGRGYRPGSAADQLRLMAHLSRWLESQGLEAGQLDPDRVDAFLVDRRSEGYRRLLSCLGVAPLVGYLRSLGVVPVVVSSPPQGPVAELLERYRGYLVGERGLVASTIRTYMTEAEGFLATRVGLGGRLDLEGLTTADVFGFVVEESGGRSVGSAKLLVSALRSLLRFLLLDGVVGHDLVPAVPPVAGWRDSRLPKVVAAGQVSQLLRSCDRELPGTGRRDFVVLTVMVRLGLRAGEVASLDVGDIDWDRGEVIIRGKGRHDERLPLPVDVGEALVDYLRHDRPREVSTRVFLTSRAPYGPVSADAAKQIVRQAARRAGLSGISAHRLRHTTATGLLEAGSSLPEVGQVLRHRSAATTAIYAKVDHRALRALGQPWPGGGAA